MDYQVSWSPQALDDVDGVAEYIARDSVFYASAVVDKIKETSKTLALFPLRGRQVPELGDTEIHERFIYSYRLIYRIRADEVLIIALLHGRQLLDIADRI